MNKPHSIYHHKYSPSASKYWPVIFVTENATMEFEQKEMGMTIPETLGKVIDDLEKEEYDLQAEVMRQSIMKTHAPFEATPTHADHHRGKINDLICRIAWVRAQKERQDEFLARQKREAAEGD